MCENVHYESVYFRELRPRILLTDNIQSGGSCSTKYKAVVQSTQVMTD